MKVNFFLMLLDGTGFHIFSFESFIVLNQLRFRHGDRVGVGFGLLGQGQAVLGLLWRKAKLATMVCGFVRVELVDIVGQMAVVRLFDDGPGIALWF